MFTSALVVFTILQVISSQDGPILEVRRHLEIFKMYRNPLSENDAPRIKARQHIEDNFRKFGLSVELQEFTTEISTNDNSVKEVSGVNIIGVSSDANTTSSVSSDANTTSSPVILIGANYDSSLQGNPLMETGVAMSSLLEIARLFQLKKDHKKFVQNSTVVFVGFDVNTKSYVPIGSGKPGSYYFVKTFLPEFLGNRTFLTAFILDSISNFNTENNSQQFFEGFEEAFPESYSKIQERGNKGDFLAMISRNDFGDVFCNSLFGNSYNAVLDSTQYHLEDLLMKSLVNPYFIHVMSKHSHYPFWAAIPPLQSTLITDMGLYRRPADEAICQSECDVDKFWTRNRKKFVETTAEAVLNTLIRLQITNSGSPTMSDAWIICVFSLSIISIWLGISF